MQLKIWAAILLASVAWGTNGVATRAALNDGVPMVAIRAVLATLVLSVLLRFTGRRVPKDLATWSTGIVQGVFQLSVPFVLFNLAYQHASAGFVGLLVALVPLTTAIVAHFLLPDERLHLAKVLSLTVAFAGVGVLLWSGDSGLEQGGRPLLAAVLATGAVLSISYAGVYAKSHAERFDPMELTYMQFAIGIVLIGATMLITEGLPGAISPWGWTLIVYMAIIGSIVPFLTYFWLLQQVSATKASLVGYVLPLVSLVAGILLVDEELQLGIGVGGLLILLGVVLTDRSERELPLAPVR
jgi:drug/metabolite transporter (DMT)-like permease